MDAMFAVDCTYVGVEPVSSKSFAYAALDKGLNVIALAKGGLEQVVSFLAARESTAAINAPPRAQGIRRAEAELRARGILLPCLPEKEEACSARIRAAFALYRALAEAGFEKVRPILETHPLAGFSVMLGRVPLPRASLEGRLQRQAILYERGLRIKDPMDFFEELTRHKMLRGIFPMEALYSPEQLDALAAAYTVWLAVNKPEKIYRAGDEAEGTIALPERELQEAY